MITQTLEYNKDKGTISLCTYSDDGFLESELDITDKVTIYCEIHEKYFEQRLNIHLKGYDFS